MRKFDIEILSPVDEALIDACAETLKNIPETEVNVSIGKTADRSGKGGDAHLTVEEHGVSTPYSVECKTHLAAVVEATLRQVRAAAAAADLRNTRPMIMAPYVNDALGARLRKENVDYVDSAGNAYVHTQVPPLLIFLRGHKPLEKPPAAGRLFDGISGLQLIALFLNAADSVTWPYRDLAEAAGISLGSASQLMTEMRREGYLRRGPNRLNETTDLLERWMRGYQQRLRPRLFRKRYRTSGGRGVDDLVPLLAKMPEVLIGGELAGALMTKMLRPGEATLHVPQEMDSRRLMSGLRLLPDAAGNVQVLSQFGKSEVWQRRGSGEVSLAAPLLVYAELMEVPDDRVRATARAVYDLEIAPYVADFAELNVG